MLPAKVLVTVPCHKRRHLLSQCESLGRILLGKKEELMRRGLNDRAWSTLSGEVLDGASEQVLEQRHVPY